VPWFVPVARIAIATPEKQDGRHTTSVNQPYPATGSSKTN
jgi:hypothetical protein